jgi:hypothetical protein
MFHTADTAPHAENTHFSRHIGVRAGDIEIHTFLKGHFCEKQEQLLLEKMTQAFFFK